MSTGESEGWDRDEWDGVDTAVIRVLGSRDRMLAARENIPPAEFVETVYDIDLDDYFMTTRKTRDEVVAELRADKAEIVANDPASPKERLEAAQMDRDEFAKTAMGSGDMLTAEEEDKRPSKLLREKYGIRLSDHNSVQSLRAAVTEARNEGGR